MKPCVLLILVGAVVSTGLSTVTVTGLEVVRLPAASRATAVKLYIPFRLAVVSHAIP